MGIERGNFNLVGTPSEQEKPMKEERFQKGNIEVIKRYGEKKYESVEVFTSQGEHTLRLNDFLPTAWTIRERSNVWNKQRRRDRGITLELLDQSSNVDPKEKTITIPEHAPIIAYKEDGKADIDGYGLPLIVDKEPFLKQRGSFLTTLHEIGHVNYLEQHSDKDYEHAKLIMEKTLSSIIGLQNYDDETLKRYATTVLKHERTAWTYALRELRRLRTGGIDLEPDMSQQDLLDYVRKKLDTYTLASPKPDKSETKPEIDRKGRRVQ